MHAASIFTVGTGIQLPWLEAHSIYSHKPVTFSFLCCLPLFCSPFLTFSVIVDVPGLPFTKSFKGFHVSLCSHSLPLLVYLTLCILDSGTMSGPDMSLGVCYLCCRLLIYTHLPISTLWHSCSSRFWFIDYTYILAKYVLFQKMTLCNIISCFQKFYFKYSFQP